MLFEHHMADGLYLNHSPGALEMLIYRDITVGALRQQMLPAKNTAAVGTDIIAAAEAATEVKNMYVCSYFQGLE